jgi:ubiquinone/menaquinone biosynthesis C-methylase UbiE
MAHMDITDLGLDDNSFSLVWCSHVLEHIENDHQAMSEVYRVLKPNGLAVIQVPIYRQKTYEDSAIQSPEERLKHFYQDDHVRLCGLDIVQRLQNVGFKVNVIDLSKLRDNHISKYGLDEPSTREIFLCSKH